MRNLKNIFYRALLVVVFLPGIVIAPKKNDLSLERCTVKSNILPVFYEFESLGSRIVTAYSSTVEECDQDPFITASGQRVREGIIATNEFPIGTKIEIDGRVYEVQDRTNKRYQYRIDIWKPSREEALNWGKQIKEIKLIK